MVRIMIILLVLGSGYLGWRAWEQHKQIEQYEIAMADGGQVDKDIAQIQKLAFSYTNLMRMNAQEGIKGDPTEQSSISQYVREVAQRDDVQWGAVSVGSPKSSPVKIGNTQYEDTTYRVEHSDSKDIVGRGNIANLFWLLERGSTKLKVTRIEVTPANKAKENEIPDDEWDVEFDVTVRRPVGKKGK